MHIDAISVSTTHSLSLSLCAHKSISSLHFTEMGPGGLEILKDSRDVLAEEAVGGVWCTFNPAIAISTGGDVREGGRLRCKWGDV